jgi:hypothetical protein
MRKRIGKQIILMAAFVAACSGGGSGGPLGDSGDVVSAGLDLDFVLPIGATALVDQGELRITFMEVVEDSRCPTDVTCVWEGNGKIALELVHSGIEVAVGINTTLDPLTAEFRGYLVRMIDLDPLPISERPTDPSQYRATLRVTREES